MSGVIAGAITAAAAHLALEGTTELAKRGERRLRDKILGTQEEQALRRVWTRAFERLVAYSRAAGLAPAERELLGIWLRRFAEDPEIGRQLLALALDGQRPPLDQLRRRCIVLGGAPAWFPGGFDGAIETLVEGLTDALREEGGRPDSALRHRVALAGMDLLLRGQQEQGEVLRDIRSELGLGRMERMERMLAELVGQHRTVGEGISALPGEPEARDGGGMGLIEATVRGVGPQRPVDPAALGDPYAALARLMSEETRQRLEAMRDAWREGRGAEARAWVDGLRHDTDRWAALAAGVKAELLRFQARLVLDDTADTGQARRLADEASALAPDDRSTLSALIAYKEAGAEAALAALDGRDDADSLTLRAALLLELERADDALATLDRAAATGTPGPEQLRLRALCSFLLGDLASARDAAARARELAPLWTTVRFAGAFIDYYSALSPLAVPRYLAGWPPPLDRALVKRDDVSLALLRDAVAVFRELAAEATEQE